MMKLVAMLAALGGLNLVPAPTHAPATPNEEVVFGSTTPYDLMRARALITTPPDTPEETPTKAEWPSLRAALLATAVRMEILDRREMAYILVRLEDFESDLEIIRGHYQGLKDAPPLSDAEVLPHQNYLNEAIRFNRAYLRQLEERILWEPDREEVLSRAMFETEQLYAVWAAARDAKSDYYYVTTRRAGLLRLRELVGAEAYTNGELPPVVPTWRFIQRSWR